MSQVKKHFLADIEEKQLRKWESDKTFEMSLDQRKDGPIFSFYDGPPFANGTPHYGHLLQTTIKDTVTRYKTMRGYYVPRRVGWDTHGLPVEYAIEKEHGFRGKQDIIKYGIDKFNAECRDSVFKYKHLWEQMFKRVGRWADYDKTYATLDESYIESVWWVFKTIYDKGLVYKDFRSAPYCPRCATPLSNFELNQGYQDNIEDPSLFVKFKLIDEDAYLLGWTTTPWSLPGNAAIAVKPDAKYVYVELKDDEGRTETVILARNALKALNVDSYHIAKEVKGQDLVSKRYEPVFKLSNLDQYDNQANLYQVWPADFVSIEDGSGVLHVAPAFGEDDLNLGKERHLPIIVNVDDNGRLKTDLGLPEDIAGKFFKSADAPIIANLAKENKVYSAETIKHTYPFCWRCDTPLLYYATDSWLVKVTSLKDELTTNNDMINWVPEHIKTGRFGKWLENVRDWAISRNRFWGAPLPIWVTDDGEVTVIGSVEELKQKALNPEMIADLHRPFIDKITIKTESGKVAKRIPEVFDCWFESGSMPYAQDHYPFENKDKWEKNFPADFVAEAIDQTRGWFYTLHVLGSALFNKPAFENVISSGWIVAADGEKLSKRKKNYAPMDEIFDLYGVDSMRFFMASSPLVNGEDTRFSTDFLRDVQRKVFMTLNSVFDFYKLYAEVDGYEPSQPLVGPQSDNILDQWILSRLNDTISHVTKALDDYRLDRAARPIQDLLDDVSNWYVRRSRRRFWKGEDDNDKQNAYITLHHTLLRLCQLLAPFSPFLVDHLWEQLVKDTDAVKSVHLSDWPEPGPVDKELIHEMIKVRELIAEGLAQRAEAGIKVRQPLSAVQVPKVPDRYKDIIADELNVKEVSWTKHRVKLDTKLTPELRREGLMREIVRHVQQARKQAELEVDDRIQLWLESASPEINEVLKNSELLADIQRETLAKSFNKLAKANFNTTVKVDGSELSVNLSKMKA